MFVEVLNTLCQVLRNRFGRFEVRVVESRPLQNQEPWLNKVQPRSIRRRPNELDSGWLACPKMKRFLMGAEVIPHDVNLASVSELRDYSLGEKNEDVFGGLGGTRSAHGTSTVRRESRQQLNRCRSVISGRPTRRLFAPTATTSRNGGERAHFIDADDNAVGRRRAIEVYDLVFFTSKSGSLLSHHVWPALNLNPSAWRRRRIVDRVTCFRPAFCCRCCCSFCRDHVVNFSPRSFGRAEATLMISVVESSSYRRGRPLLGRSESPAIPESRNRLTQRCAFV